MIRGEFLFSDIHQSMNAMGHMQSYVISLTLHVTHCLHTSMNVRCKVNMTPKKCVHTSSCSHTSMKVTFKVNMMPWGCHLLCMRPIAFILQWMSEKWNSSLIIHRLFLNLLHHYCSWGTLHNQYRLPLDFFSNNTSFSYFLECQNPDIFPFCNLQFLLNCTVELMFTNIGPWLLG